MGSPAKNRSCHPGGGCAKPCLFRGWVNVSFFCGTKQLHVYAAQDITNAKANARGSPFQAEGPPSKPYLYISLLLLYYYYYYYYFFFFYYYYYYFDLNLAAHTQAQALSFQHCHGGDLHSFHPNVGIIGNHK